MLSAVAWTQAIYYLATGIWPLVSIRTFMAVTGPKTDVWLVKTVGAVVAAIGAALAVGAARRVFPPETLVLAVGSAAVLMLVDVIYVHRRIISRIYLADAVAQLILIAAWLIGWGLKG
jgi:hypothetical protein